MFAILHSSRILAFQLYYTHLIRCCPCYHNSWRGHLYQLTPYPSHKSSPTIRFFSNRTSVSFRSNHKGFPKMVKTIVTFNKNWRISKLRWVIFVFIESSGDPSSFENCSSFTSNFCSPFKFLNDKIFLVFLYFEPDDDFISHYCLSYFVLTSRSWDNSWNLKAIDFLLIQLAFPSSEYFPSDDEDLRIKLKAIAAEFRLIS